MKLIWKLSEADAPEGSFEQIREDLNKALRKSNIFPADRVGGEVYVYIRFTYPDSIICEYKNSLYLIPYTKVNNSVIFGDVSEVKEKTTIEKVKNDIAEAKSKRGSRISELVSGTKNMKLADSVKLIESADDKKGFKWKVQIIEAGVSSNRNYYPEETLIEAIPLYEGVRAMSRTDSEHSTGDGKSAKNITGWFENITWDKALKSLVGEFNIVESAVWLKDMLLSAYNKGKTDLVGFSIVADGIGSVKRLGEALVRHIDKIINVDFVDVVVSPSAGGKVLQLIESKNGMEDLQMIEKILKLIEAMLPEQFKLVKDETDPDKLIECLKTGLEKTMDGKSVDRIVEALKPVVPEVKAPEVPGTPVKITEAAKPTYDAKAEVEKLRCSMVLTEAMSGTKLPPEAVKLIEAQYKDQIFEVAKLRESIASFETMFGAFAKNNNVSGFGEDSTTVTKDEAVKLTEAFQGFFAGTKIGETPPFFSIREAYRQITGDVNITGRTENAPGLKRFVRLHESIDTTGFDQICQDAMHVTLLKEYNDSDLNNWRKIASVVPLSDLKTNHRIRYGGYANLPIVGERGTYQPLTSPTDEEATYSPAKRGGLEDLTIETIINDVVSVARNIPRKLARAGIQTLHEFVFAFLSGNAAIYDSVALFHSDHSNTATGAMTQATIVAAYKRMLKQTDMSNSKPLGITPKTLIYGIDLMETAFTETSTLKVTGNANNDASIVSKFNLEHLMVPYLSDVNNWYLAADPNVCPTIEIGFLNNKQEPELFVQDAPDYGSMFHADCITFKVRIWFGGAVVDYRGLDGNIVA
ncbi:MAG TPA: hypothetical protein VMV56_07645 [Williamwhitmania sp.]|nr:hypothetical protein [Williamwhitmania sp.]